MVKSRGIAGFTPCLCCSHSWMTLGKVLKFSKLQFSHPENEAGVGGQQ